MEAGRLYIVATPIGNLGDMVPRAVEVLKAVDLIAAEDTRHSGKLFSHFGIEGHVQAYHDHNESEKAGWLVSQLQAGKDIALVSDAGTPLISDPGYRLVAAAQRAGIEVTPIPGPSALTAALSVSGMPSDRFIFEGFLPSKPGSRLSRLNQLHAETRTLIFYESPHRIVDTLIAMEEVFGGAREIVVARELTKTYETIRRLPLAEMVVWVQQDANQQRGEFVLLVEGNAGGVQELTPEITRLLDILAAELPASKAAATAAKITGLAKKLLYKYLQED